MNSERESQLSMLRFTWKKVGGLFCPQVAAPSGGSTQTWRAAVE